MFRPRRLHSQLLARGLNAKAGKAAGRKGEAAAAVGVNGGGTTIQAWDPATGTWGPERSTKALAAAGGDGAVQASWVPGWNVVCPAHLRHAPDASLFVAQSRIQSRRDIGERALSTVSVCIH